MLEVRFTALAMSQITHYIQLYRDGYWQLYSDTGIWSEKVIRSQYEETAEKLFIDIVNTIQKTLGPQAILGRKPLSHISEICFYVSARLITVNFSDDRGTKQRIVESVSISRKNILF